jgi:hypothetical protein
MLTIRASSLSDLFACPARWEAKHVKGLRLPRTGIAQLGTAIHAGTAAFDAHRVAGDDITADDAAGALVDAIHKPESDVTWDEDMGKTDAEKIGLALHHRYCDEISPGQDYIGVELNCERLEITDLGLALTGTTDRVRRAEHGGLGVADIKTGKTAVGADGTVKLAGHGLQLGVYELLAQAVTGLPITEPAQIIGMQTGKTAKAQRIGFGFVGNARDVLLGDEDQPGMLHHAAHILKSGMFYGNPRDMLCNPKYCPAHPTCRWRS